MKRALTRREFLKAAGVGTTGMALLGTSAVSSGCSDRSNGGPMNVILVIVDSLRKDHVGSYGNDWIKTPTLDALAEESLKFNQAYPESLVTIPARRAIHTGLRTWPFRETVPQKGVPWQPYGWQRIPENQTTLSEILQANDYLTMLVSDTHPQWQPSMNFHRGFAVYDWIRGQERDLYQPPSLAPRKKIKEALITSKELGKLKHYFANTAYRETEEDWFAPQVFARAEQLLEASQGRPFFLVVDCYDPHEPWDPPDEYVSLYSKGYDGKEPFLPVYGSSDYLTEDQLNRMRALYAGEVTMMDRWLGKFLERVNDLGLMEDTLVVLLSDHGHILGEHGLIGKPFNGLYPELIEVPFLIRHPQGKGAGETSDFYASTHDVAPTILGSLGIEPSESMDGENLSVILEGEVPQERRPYFTLGYNDYSWARDEEFAMFGRNDGTEAKLFNLQEDSEMTNDVAEEHPEVVRRMFEEYILKNAGGSLPGAS